MKIALTKNVIVCGVTHYVGAILDAQLSSEGVASIEIGHNTWFNLDNNEWVEAFCVDAQNAKVIRPHSLNKLVELSETAIRLRAMALDTEGYKSLSDQDLLTVNDYSCKCVALAECILNELKHNNSIIVSR